jgi:hypothetical protein
MPKTVACAEGILNMPTFLPTIKNGFGSHAHHCPSLKVNVFIVILKNCQKNLLKKNVRHQELM